MRVEQGKLEIFASKVGSRQNRLRMRNCKS